MWMHLQIIAAVLYFLFGTIGVACAGEINQAFPASTIKNLVLTHTEGSITVSGKNTDTINVQTTKRAGDNSCITRTTASGSSLEVKTDRSLFGQITCKVDVVITMPKQTNIEANVGAGKIVLINVGGNLKVSLGAGSISGDIDSGTSKVKIGAGQIDLVWNNLPVSGGFDFEVGSGDVNLNFPKNSVINSNITKGMAMLSSHIQTSPDAKFRVVGKLGFGNISIK